MKTIKLLFTGFALCAALLSLRAQPLQSTMQLVEATTLGCGPVSDCADSIICFRIILTPDTTAVVLSYNIWVNFPNTGFSYVSDAACITQDGNDNAEFLPLGYYRVSGVLGATIVQENIPIVLHSICLKYSDLDQIQGATISVGGSLFGLFSALTYSNPTANEPNMPAYPFVMNESSISCFTILSANFLSFDARKSGDESLLHWVTVQENNVSTYDVQRSMDGGEFITIGSVEAAGSFDEQRHYYFTDEEPNAGINYYRIKQVDRDGGYRYSTIRSLVFGEDYFVVRTWPNPVSQDVLYLDIQSDSDLELELSLINTAGQLVRQETRGPGSQVTSLDLGHVAPGVYNLVVASRNNRHIERIVVLR